MSSYLIRCFNCGQFAWNDDVVSIPVHEDSFGEMGGQKNSIDQDFCIPCAEKINGSKMKVTVTFHHGGE